MPIGLNLSLALDGSIESLIGKINGPINIIGSIESLTGKIYRPRWSHTHKVNRRQ